MLSGSMIQWFSSTLAHILGRTDSIFRYQKGGIDSGSHSQFWLLRPWLRAARGTYDSNRWRSAKGLVTMTILLPIYGMVDGTVWLVTISAVMQKQKHAAV